MAGGAADADLLPLEQEVEFVPIRAQGPGGQNVNKVSCALQLRFDVAASSLPDALKARLLAIADARLNKSGVLVLRCQEYRSLEQNRAAGLARLRALVAKAAYVPAVRRPTRPGVAARRRRVEAKVLRGRIKTLRARVDE